MNADHASADPALRAIGTAAPAAYLDRAAWLERVRTLGDPAASAELLARLAERSEVETRGCAAFDPARPALFPAPMAEHRPGTAERLRRWSEAARPMAMAAAVDALARADASAAGITHLVTASCTGFESPGLDAHLIESLGLPRSVRRANIGFMGCHAAVNALGCARDAARSDPRARVLVVCAEVSTVHFHGSARPDQMVADALFADGAAAFVVDGTAREAASPRIAGVHSTLLADSAGEMRWQIGDHGFEMTLGARVPDILAREVGPWVRATLAAHHGLALEGVGAWAIHPGGPRVVDAVCASLGLPASAGDTSRAVLRAHGNMSSATIGFILSRLAASGQPRPWIALAFGPGLAGEMLVVR